MQDLICRYNYTVTVGQRPKKISEAYKSALRVITDLVEGAESNTTNIHIDFILEVCQLQPDMMENSVEHLLVAVYDEAIHTIAGRLGKGVSNVGHIKSSGEHGRIDKVVVTVYPTDHECEPQIFSINTQGGKPCLSLPTGKSYFLSSTKMEH